MTPTETLRDTVLADWQAVAAHPFTLALAEGSLPAARMAAYLVEDYRFVEEFARLLAAAVALAPDMAALVPGAQFLAVITGPENTYFLRSFAALGVPEAAHAAPPAPETETFLALMREARASGRAERMLAVLVVAEWSYLSWASPHHPADAALPFWLGEWITLHAGPGFEAVVAHLRGRLDALWPALSAADQAAATDMFARAVRAERAFFDAAWQRWSLELPDQV
ncbi:TenA family protein [Frigidibacter sp. MR17.14]|uniref:TenA family protein n=1 Tax=Frigidibacter sp. MR17.14 TaxID=3126509 RepID=UPI003012B172